MNFKNPFLGYIFSTEIVEFFKNLSLMAESGIPLNEAFGVLQDQARSATFKKFLQQTKLQLEQGLSLSEALLPYQAYIGELAINIIRAGEVNGTLEQNFKYIAELLTRRRELKQRIQSALLYPEIVLVMAFLIGGGISIFILPKLIPLFTALHVDLPLASRILLHVSLFLQKSGLLAMVGVVVGVLVLYFMTGIKVVRWFLDTLVLKIPFFGRLAQNYQLALFSQLFQTLFRSGLTIKEALQVTTQAMTNVRYRQILEKTSKRLVTGIPLSTILNTYPSFFPQNVISILSVGERSGKLDESLQYLSVYYDNEVDVQTKRLPTFVEPILLLCIGFIVAFIAMAIIAPIYEITSGIKTH
jgi:type IV pilus assembly protein PilC